jgi:hypothetical protein
MTRASASPWTRRALLALVLLSLAAVSGAATAHTNPAAPTCAALHSDSAYTDGVLGALAASKDVWGNDVLGSPDGPTYAGIHGYLHPLLGVGRPAGLTPRRLTDSGVYYLAFGQPRGNGGANEVQLHVADGSQVVSQLANGPSLTVSVGRRARERYGTCLSRLSTPRLADGYLPILETSYVDSRGVRYRQESFAARIPQTRALVSFVRLIVDPAKAKVGTAVVRFTPSVHLKLVGTQLRQGTRARVLFSSGARFDARGLEYVLHRRRTIYVAWLDGPRRTRPFVLGRNSYLHARHSLSAYWAKRLASNAQLVVPEQRVYDAERNLLIQNMLLSWRYSLGNSYGRFSWELMDVAEVMGAYGYNGIEHTILKAAGHAPTYFPNRAAGERMTVAADYFRRYHDDAYVRKVTPAFRRTVDSFARQIAADSHGLLQRERYGSDIAEPIYGMHAQALALQGLWSMVPVWQQTGYPALAAEAADVAVRLQASLRAAVSSSEQYLPDGSLFVPIALVDGLERPYDKLTATKRGAYWNLVMPYALASGFFRPGSAESSAILRYLLDHGGRFLGLVRFAPHTGVTNPGYQSPGTDDVYGTNVARFLADNDQRDQLLLSLYGKLAAGMTENTFVSGEGSTIGPVKGQYFRAMHRPPNSANNAFFLETLRLTLVHETTDSTGQPQGLELAYSTPRAWLEQGKQIAVRRMQTSFGPLTFTIDSAADAVHVQLDVPPGFAGPLRLRLRLPNGQRIAAVTVNGAPWYGFAGPETIDLTGLSGHVDLLAVRR